MSKEVKLNVGCGHKQMAGWTNIDSSEKVKPDIVADICKLPFKDNSVDEIYTNHTLEHIPDFMGAMRELHRILKPGGKLTIVVPYPAKLTTYLPQHVNYFTWKSMDPFVDKDDDFGYYQNFHFKSLKRELIFYHPFAKLFAKLANSHPTFYEVTILCYLVSAGEIKFELIK